MKAHYPHFSPPKFATAARHRTCSRSKLLQTACNAADAVKSGGMKAEPAGIYVHIPFCLKKCSYCDFYSITDQSLVQPLIGALLGEMQMLSRGMQVPFRFDTIYIGGGTPSVLAAADIGRIIEAAGRSFQILAGAEITIEANPDTVKLKQLKGYRSAGANRINIGVQSFNDANLSFLGRIHSGQEAELAINRARQAGFDNIGLDLIYGLPGQTKKSWLLDLRRAIEFEPEHLAGYMLTYEPGTPLKQDRQKRRFTPLPETLVGDMFETTIAFLNSHGYVHYEISNFARSMSTRSRHNLKYWSSAPYSGLGPAAHSFVEPCRSWNHRNVKKYIQSIEAGRLPLEGKEVLTRKQRMIETIYLELRKTDGIDINIFDKKFNVSFKKTFKTIITDLEQKEFIRISQDRCALNPRGMLLQDSITANIIDLIPSSTS